MCKNEEKPLSTCLLKTHFSTPLPKTRNPTRHLKLMMRFDFFFETASSRTWFMCFVLDCMFFYNAAHSSLAMPTKFFFLVKEDCAKFLHGYFQKCWDIYYTLSSHLLEICNVIRCAKTKNTHIHIFFPFKW